LLKNRIDNRRFDIDDGVDAHRDANLSRIKYIWKWINVEANDNPYFKKKK
jgi:hypothetical protein